MNIDSYAIKSLEKSPAKIFYWNPLGTSETVRDLSENRMFKTVECFERSYVIETILRIGLNFCKFWLKLGLKLVQKDENRRKQVYE